MQRRSEEFKREAVRIALASGLPRERVAAALGVGKSTLGKWLAQYQPTGLIPAPQADLAREDERLNLQNRLLKVEKDILKGHTVLREPAAVRFAPRVFWRGELAARVLCGDDLQGDADQEPWLSFMAHTADQPAFPHRHGNAGPYPGTV